MQGWLIHLFTSQPVTAAALLYHKWVYVKCGDQARVNAMSQGPVSFSLVIRLVESKGGAKVIGVQL